MTTLSPTQDKTRLLRSALLGNGIFSFLSGLVFTLFSESVADFLGYSAPSAILVIGLTLIAFALLLFMQSRAETINRTFTWFVIIADVLWVIGSVLLIFMDPFGFTTAGKWAIAVIADIVTVFAILQYVGLRRITV